MSAQQRELALDLLKEKAGIQGYLTTDDIVAIFPDCTQDTGKLRALFITLRHRGVDVLMQTKKPHQTPPPKRTHPSLDLEPHSNEHLSGDDSMAFISRNICTIRGTRGEIFSDDP